MPGLKELRTRIESVKSTRKITSAMKMVAAARLRKAQQLLSTSLPYAHTLLASASRTLQELKYEEGAKGVAYEYPKILSLRGAEGDAAIPAESKPALLLVFSSDRGLCGGFNVYVCKAAVARIEELKGQGRAVKVICVGRKGRDMLKRKHAEYIAETIEGFSKKGADYAETAALGGRIRQMFEAGEIASCELVSSRFVSAITRTVEPRQILPVDLDAEPWLMENPAAPMTAANAFYDYEPDKMRILEDLLGQIFAMEVFQAAAHSSASEEGARMTSMDNATRNARDMISRLTLKYNGIRQSAITTELIEIISGAEAL